MRADTERPVIGLTYSSPVLSDFDLWRHMFNGVTAAGGTPVAIDCELPVPHLDHVLSRVDGLIISGGGDVDATRYGGDPDDPKLYDVNPARDDTELAALEAARTRSIPVLAICRGVQLLNVAFGGTLYQDLVRDTGTELDHSGQDRPLDAPTHPVEVEPGTVLWRWLGEQTHIAVNSEHHQGIDKLAADLTATAWSPDGLIEGIEHPDEPIVAVQWHPEVLWATEGHALRLLTSFIDECAATAQRQAETR
ncbi:MAG: gamma-glutamyl-gamma-aminobutyrate hydrolase family protein [Nocardioidaceae bacterium]|nr:MAG: gamma-glutamyl-gamma-aminobutyrate hydrolase family protein [Nocardioidaceae bacterium]